MNLQCLINESTYDLSFVDELYSYLVDKLKNKNQFNISRTFDITKFFPQKYNVKNRKVFIHIRQDLKKDITNANLEVWKNRVIINIVGRGKFGNYNVSILKRLLNHEIIHALDFLRKNIDYIEYPSKRAIRVSQEDKFPLSYWNDEMEFNVAINSIKKYKDKFPYSWNAIKDYEQLVTILRKSASLAKETKHIIADPFLKKKLYKRLIRENLFPPNLKF